MARPEEVSYHGNPNLKPLAYQHDFTKEEIAEYVKCQKDPKYFIENYVKIVTLDRGLQPFKLFDCQKGKVDLIMNERKVILMEKAPNFLYICYFHCMKVQKYIASCLINNIINVC